MTDHPCQAPPSVLELTAGLVDIWLLDLDPSETEFQRLQSTLNASERERADRFRREILRRRFIAGRGYLRSILGGYLGRDPSSIVFEYGSHGKPGLADPSSALEFNLAHSKGIAVCGLTRDNPIGVDIETDRPVDMADRIIQRFFSAAEQKEFQSLAVEDQPAAFLRGWTRKEAFIKALGMGLAYPLDGFDVSLGSENARILRVGDDPDEASRWSLVDIAAGDAAAAVVRGPIREVRVFQCET